MRLVNLSESGLGIAEQEILALFEPFVDGAASAREGAWGSEVARRKQKLVKRTARRLLLPWRTESRRGEATVVGEYDKAWRSIDYGAYAEGAAQRDYTPWEWRGRRMFASDVGGTRFRQLLLIRIIERIRLTMAELGTVSAQSSCDQLFDKLMVYQSGSKQDDDVTLVAVHAK